jgi:hypothetical protein
VETADNRSLGALAAHDVPCAQQLPSLQTVDYESKRLDLRY